MKGFKKWLEDLDRKQVDPATTVDYKPQTGDRTPSVGNDVTHVITPSGEKEGEGGLIARISQILKPIDPHLIDRATDGRVIANFSGSPSYTSPEEAEKIMKPRYEHAADEIENFLKRCAEHFVWLEKPCLTLLKCWMKFRSMLHIRTEGVNPVLYQVNLLRLKDFEKHFPVVDDAVQNCEDSDKHAAVIDAWNTFYTAWTKLVPTLKHYLVTFEKNSARR